MTSFATPFPLGRLQHHDPRNRAWRALVEPPPRNDHPYEPWWTRDVFDQIDSPQCTVEAAIGLLRTAPLRHTYEHVADYDTFDERRALYLVSQTVDPWPGEDYDGTSTDAPFKILRERGVISSWRWLFGEDELHEWVSWYGPAAVGTVWLSEMFFPSKSNGFIEVSGSEMGGHAYRVVQYSDRLDAYRIVNSWGRGWGRNGRAWIARSDMRDLLANGGEAVTI